MKIDENYTIEPDAYCWILKYEEKTGRLNKKGREVITSKEWFVPTLASGLKRYSDESLKKCKELSDVLNKQKEILSLVSEIKSK